MKSRIFLGVLVFVVLFLICFLPSFAYYSFLSPEANEALEVLKEKFREKEIVLEKEEGIIWVVIIPKNSGVETEEIMEMIYSDEKGKLGTVYTFTKIIITNPEGWTRIIWGAAAKSHPYDIPKLCFVFDG